MSDRKTFAKAMNKWERLHKNHEYSLPPEDGVRAFLYSTNGWISQAEDERLALEQAHYYEREAYRLALHHERILGGNAVVLAGVTQENFGYVLGDRAVSDIVVIGDGHFSAFYSSSPKGEDDKFIDWYDISKMTTHLKLGKFVHRACGVFEYHLGVPAGAFAMSRHSSVYSPFNRSFAPEDHVARADIEKEEAKIIQVYPFDKLTIDYVRTNFPLDESGEVSA